MGDDISEPFKKWKKRFKRAICCGVFTVLFGILSIVAGIALLVYFAKYWGDTDEWERHLAYTGCAVLLLGVVCLAVAVIVFIVIYRIYKRIETGGHATGKTYTPKFGAGEAPYPQQQATPLSPTAPSQQPAMYQGTDQSDVKIQVAEHHRF